MEVRSKGDVTMKIALCLAAGLALALILAWPVITAADSSGTVVVTGSIAPTISSVNPTSGVQGNTYSVTITGTDFESGVAVDFGAGITTAISTVTSTQITVSITISSGATSGSRDVAVTVSGATGKKTSGFSVVATSFSITSPTAISLGNMTRTQTTAGHSAQPGSISTNAASWQVVARDTKSVNAGYMYKDGSSSTHLRYPLRLGKASDSCNTNAGDSAGLVYSNPESSLALYVEQDIDSSDTAGTYSITITFTGSPQ